MISWSGRASRKTFWKYLGLFLLIYFLSYFAVGANRGARHFQGAETIQIVWGILVYIGFIPVLGVMVRRLHDGRYSAWWLVPFLVAPFLFAFLGMGMRNLDAHATATLLSFSAFAFAVWGVVQIGFLRGTMGANEFGLDPIAATTGEIVMPTANWDLQAATTHAPARRSKAKWALGSVGAVLLLVIVASVLEAGHQLKQLSPQMRDQIVGCARAQRFVQATLKAPSTAEFAACQPTTIAIRVAVDEWVAHGYFVEQVSGAKKLSHYTVRMRHRMGTKDWAPIDVAVRVRPSKPVVGPPSKEPPPALRDI
jgi:uncharacterized membrane protein YhaH (DUF805 family)